MPIPRNRYTVATGIAALMLLLTACFSSGSDAAKSQQADNGPTSTQTTESVAVPTDAPTLPAASPTPPISSAAPTAPPQFSRLKTPSAYQTGAAPVSQNLSSGGVNVEAYLLSVLRSNRDVWRTTLGANGLQMPTLTYDVTIRSDRYVSACLRGGKPIEVTAS